MDTFNKLAELFRAFPGIGHRQAKRFVYFLLSRDHAFSSELVKLVSALRDEIVRCESCFRWFPQMDSHFAHVRNTATAVCSICTDPHRDIGELMVVAKDTDLEAMEKSGVYKGRYFVLGGTMALIEKKSNEVLHVHEMVERVKRSVTPRETAQTPLKEVILALSVNPDGEHTTDELKKLLSPLGVQLTTLGRGLSTGSELEYADKETLKSALKNRTK